MQLPDVNVWLALVFESHKQHTNAREWFEQMTSSEVIFCRLTMLGFLRLAQTEAAFPGEAVSSEVAWSFYQAFLSDERVTFWEEPSGLDDLLAGYFSGMRQPSPKQVTDSYLAAFVRLHGLTLYTFDAALQNHPLLK